jgi:hypothetical protein
MAVHAALITDQLLQPNARLQFDSATSPPGDNTWYYDQSTRKVVSNCDAD